MVEFRVHYMHIIKYLGGVLTPCNHCSILIKTSVADKVCLGKRSEQNFNGSTGSAKAKGREPKTCLGRVFNYKLGCFNDVNVLIYVDAGPHL
jgi:hypothetical protein